MFLYFGGKTTIAHRYPPPTHGLIVEPFAGSARYALLHCRHHEVWVNDLDPLVCDIWRYVQRASRRDIEALPELGAGESLDRHRWLSAEERALVGWCLGFSRPSPGRTCTDWAAEKRTVRLLKKRLLEHREYVRCWRVTNLHYASLPNVRATWFVDPPYQHSRSLYRYHCVADYARLADWCRSRAGQVIVCEGKGATWLPFRPLLRHHVGTGGYFDEVVWTRTTD